MQVAADVPLMLGCLMRPALAERRPSWKRPDSVGECIELDPLDKRASRELAGELLSRPELVPSTLRELLTGSAEGNFLSMSKQRDQDDDRQGHTQEEQEDGSHGSPFKCRVDGRQKWP